MSQAARQVRGKKARAVILQMPIWPIDIGGLALAKTRGSAGQKTTRRQVRGSAVGAPLVCN